MGVSQKLFLLGLLLLLLLLSLLLLLFLFLTLFFYLYACQHHASDFHFLLRLVGLDHRHLVKNPAVLVLLAVALGLPMPFSSAPVAYHLLGREALSCSFSFLSFF